MMLSSRLARLVSAPACLISALAAQHPALPGVERLRAAASSTPAERGAVLLRELSCTACHEGPDHLAARPAPDLRRVGARVTASWLRRFLRDPQGTKPGTLMPRVDTGSAETRGDDLEALVHYLASRGGPLPVADAVASHPQAEAGRRLFDSIGCAACHAPGDGRKTAVASVPLDGLAHKTTVDALRRFLRAPHEVRPAGRMPDLRLSEDEARNLSMYLLRAQIDNPLAADVAPPKRRGLYFTYHEIDKSEMPDFARSKPVAEGHLASITPDLQGVGRKTRYALRLRATIEIPKDGVYRFWVRSDDGSRLLIDGDPLIPDGANERTGEVELTKGPHAFELEYFQWEGGRRLEVSWKGPGTRRRRIPDEAFSNRLGRPMLPLESAERGRPAGADPYRVARGRQLFEEAGCAACHEPARSRTRGKPLRDLDPGRAGGCLDAAPAGGAVAFGLSQVQRDELRAALRAGVETAPAAAAQVRRTMAGLNCYACHARDGIGGPEDARDELFGTLSEVDLGDEGRVPPPLTGAGDKLREDSLAAIVEKGEHHIRGRYMATRMPGYTHAAIGDLAAQLAAADRPEAAAKVPPFSLDAVEAGRRLVGLQGVACVTCHNVNGDRAAAIPGVDIATAHRRLRADWFQRFLNNPPHYRPGTRMPGFWSAGVTLFPDLLGGDPGRQIGAVWSYLSLGASMPRPFGVQRDGDGPKMELRPTDEPIVHRTFMEGVGPRTILCGYPESLNVAFDAQSVRLAQAWRGRFFDASGVASGRTDKFLSPLGTDVLDLPSPAFARLPDDKAAWPPCKDGDRDVGGRFRGYVLDDKRRPVFRYEVAGVEVREQPLPQLRPGGAMLERRFELRRVAPGDRLFLLAWRDKEVRQVGAGTWKCGPVTVRLQLPEGTAVSIRPAGGAQELLVRVDVGDAGLRFSEVIEW